MLDDIRVAKAFCQSDRDVIDQLTLSRGSSDVIETFKAFQIKLFAFVEGAIAAENRVQSATDLVGPPQAKRDMLLT